MFVREMYLYHIFIVYRFATGIEFRESSMMIGPKCTATAKAGQHIAVKYFRPCNWENTAVHRDGV